MGDLRLRALLVLAIAAFAVGCPPPSAQLLRVSLPTTHRFLDNGLEVVLHEDHRSPFVAIRVRYHAGGKDDPPGAAGLAHLVEHLSYVRTAHIERDEMMALFSEAEAHGQNGSTSADTTDYYATLPSTRLALGLWIERERMATLEGSLDDEGLRREKDVVTNELRQRYVEQPYGAVHLAALEALFPAGHPYHFAPIGKKEQIEAISLEVVREFVRAHYRPNEATLAIVGDFRTEEALALVERYFGGIAPGAPRKPLLVAPQVVHGPVRLAMDASVDAPRVYLSWAGPPVASPAARALEVAAGYIGGGAGARMRKDKVGTSASVGLEARRLGTLVWATLEVDEVGGAPTAIQDLDAAVLSMRQAGWEQALSRAQASMIVDGVRDLEPLSSRAETMLDDLQWLGKPDAAQERLHAISGVDVGAVSDAMGYLALDRAVIVVVHPSRSAPPGGVIAGAKP